MSSDSTKNPSKITQEPSNTGRIITRGSPGFGELSQKEELPDMRDLPTISKSSTSESSDSDQSSDVTSSTAGQVSKRDNPIGRQTNSSDISEITGKGDLTTAEKIAILDAELKSSAGRFDQAISEARTEQQKDRIKIQSKKSDTDIETPPQNTMPEDGLDSIDPRTGELRKVVSAGSSKDDNAETYPIPEDILDNSKDEDVTAKQLRERAEREPDPVKREALWERYRKYMGIKK